MRLPRRAWSGGPIDLRSCKWRVDEGTHTANYTDGSVMRAPLTGGTPVTLASGQRQPTAIAVDATSVYWANKGGDLHTKAGIVKVAKGGGTPVTLASKGARPSAIAVDADSVYWWNMINSATRFNASVMKVAKHGGTP